MFQQFVQTFNEEIPLSADGLAAFTFSLLAGWISAVVTAYLADVISSALLNGKKGNLIITFVLFIALNYVIQKILQLVPSTLAAVTVLLLQGGVALVLAVVMYIVTAKLMDRYLSV